MDSPEFESYPRDTPEFDILINKQPFTLRYDNCVMIRMRSDPSMDYIYVYEDEENQYAFFDQPHLMQRLDELGYVCTLQPYPDDNDINFFVAHHRKMLDKDIDKL